VAAGVPRSRLPGISCIAGGNSCIIQASGPLPRYIASFARTAQAARTARPREPARAVTMAAAGGRARRPAGLPRC
jgi:hypothetical protein